MLTCYLLRIRSRYVAIAASTQSNHAFQPYCRFKLLTKTKIQRGKYANLLSVMHQVYACFNWRHNTTGVMHVNHIDVPGFFPKLTSHAL